ncbi:MAG: signal peptidase I [Spirochaetota bacterium]
MEIKAPSLSTVRATEALINFFRYRTYRQKLRAQKISALRDWTEVLLSVFLAVLMINQYLVQLFVIPSSSMVPTLLVKDRVIVNKLAYGLEPYPFGPKLISDKEIQRGTVIPFISPEYRRPGTLFIIIQRITFLLTFGQLDLDLKVYQNKQVAPLRLASQPMLYTPASQPNYQYSYKGYQPPLLVKRVIAVGGDKVRFVSGEPEIRLAGSKRFLSEEHIKKELGLNYKTQRDMKVFNQSNFYAMDSFYEKRVRNAYLSNPHDIASRSRFIGSRLGDAIPPGYFEPFGDNRDHSHDGRWFGILNRDDLQGRVTHIVAPFSRFRSLSPSK